MNLFSFRAQQFLSAAYVVTICVFTLPTAFAQENKATNSVEEKLIVKATSREPITGNDDPALKTWAEGIVKTVQQRDLKFFETEVLPTGDELWEVLKAGYAEGKAPPRESFDKSWKEFSAFLVASAKKLNDQLEQFGVVLKNEKVSLKSVEATDTNARRSPTGPAIAISARSVAIVFSVASDKKTSGGKAIAGDYVIAGSDMMKFGEHWMAQGGMRWEKLPEGVLSAEDRKALELEQYISKNGRLPVGHKAPDAVIVLLSDNSKAKLSDYRGKVLLIDFWSTWCVPCQKPMEELQHFVKENPQWKDKVVVMSLSVDAKPETAINHLEKRGWTNTFNVWGGEGEFRAEAPKAYHVRGIPTTYIIDPKGNIAWAGHPGGEDIPALINKAMK